MFLLEKFEHAYKDMGNTTKNNILKTSERVNPWCKIFGREGWEGMGSKNVTERISFELGKGTSSL